MQKDVQRINAINQLDVAKIKSDLQNDLNSQKAQYLKFLRQQELEAAVN